MDIVTLSLAKKYVDKTLEGMGSLKGAPAQIKTIEKTPEGHKIIFLWEDNDGGRHESELIVKDATINGFNAIELTGGENIKIDQIDENFIISFDDTDIKGAIDKINEDLGTAQTDIQTLQNEVDHLDEHIKIDENTIGKTNDGKLQSIGSVLKNGGYQNYWKGTKSQFNAISEKDNNTIYEVVDDEETTLFEVDGASIEFGADNSLRVPNNIDLMFQSILYGNGESGYRKYRNGMLEQWGVTTSSANGETDFTMHQPHIDTNFSIFVEPRERGNFYHYALPSGNQKFACRIQTRDSANIAVRFQWRSWGRWK